jgi:xylan 1,4-beta-xylosidase
VGRAPSPVEATIRRIDVDHANAKRQWQELGSPDYLSTAIVAELDSASRCDPEPQAFEFHDRELDFSVVLPPLSVAAVTFHFAALDGG